ncbi:MAG: FAD-dependent oxidoreductase [Vicinamibacterales bacterium]
MNRRTALKTGSLAAIGVAFGGCATRTRQAASARAPRPMVLLPPVKVSWDRVIRTTVGLRPFRPAGFVLRADRLDDKTLIHNYGHGGSGWSLSWGTGYLAAEIALETPHRRAAVIGCGVVGLAAARLLQRRGFETTIYAAAVPPETTSNMALAGFTPTSGLVDLSSRTPEWDAQFRRAVEIGYRQWQLLVGPHWGVTWVDNFSPTDDDRAAGGGNPLLPDTVRGARELLGPGEHPFPTRYAVRRQEMRYEPSIFLDAAVRDFLLFGGKIVVRRFSSAADLATLAEPVIVNCTGLGSRDLVGDTALTPLKGQLTVLIPQAEIHYSTTGGLGTQPNTPGGFVHMMPRTDGIVLGGTSERDVWTLEPNESERTRVIERHIELFGSLRTSRLPTSRLPT